MPHREGAVTDRLRVRERNLSTAGDVLCLFSPLEVSHRRPPPVSPASAEASSPSAPGPYRPTWPRFRRLAVKGVMR